MEHSVPFSYAPLIQSISSRVCVSERSSPVIVDVSERRVKADVREGEREREEDRG